MPGISEKNIAGKLPCPDDSASTTLPPGISYVGDSDIYAHLPPTPAERKSLDERVINADRSIRETVRSLILSIPKGAWPSIYDVIFKAIAIRDNIPYSPECFTHMIVITKYGELEEGYVRGTGEHGAWDFDGAVQFDTTEKIHNGLVSARSSVVLRHAAGVAETFFDLLERTQGMGENVPEEIKGILNRRPEVERKIVEATASISPELLEKTEQIELGNVA